MSTGHVCNWLRATTRAAIHTRDGWRCCWCGACVDTHGLCLVGRNVQPDLVLTVDHIRPLSAGGTNDPHNLLTACWECNTNRGGAPVLSMLAWLDAEGRDLRTVRLRLKRARLDLTPYRCFGRLLERERPFWYARHKARAGAEGHRVRINQLRFGFGSGVVVEVGPVEVDGAVAVSF